MIETARKVGAAALDDIRDRRGFRSLVSEIKYNDSEVWQEMTQGVGSAALASLSPGDRVGPNGEYVVVPVGAARGCLAYLGAMDARELGVCGMKARADLAAALKEQDK